MKKVFVLEDSEFRIRWFKEIFAYGNDLIIVNSVKDAVAYLNNNDPYIMFLDHDLDGEIYVDSFKENTGYRLAEWIYKNGKTYNKIIIHSLNQIGVDNMFYMLTRKPSAKEVKKIPFSDLVHYDSAYLLK